MLTRLLVVCCRTAPAAAVVLCCRTAPAAAVQEAPLTWAPARMHLCSRQVGDNGAHACAGLLQATCTDLVPLPVPSSPCAAHTCAGCCLDLGSAASCTASAHTSCRCPAASLTYYMPSFDYSCDSHDAAAAKARHTLTGSSSESEDTSRCRKDQVRGTAGPCCLLRQCCVSQGHPALSDATQGKTQ